MNKVQVIENLAMKTALRKSDVSKIVDAFFEVIKEELKMGGKVSFIGFGAFKVNDRRARKGRDLRTGATIQIPASKVPVFKAGKALKETVNHH